MYVYIYVYIYIYIYIYMCIYIYIYMYIFHFPEFIIKILQNNIHDDLLWQYSIML